MKLSSINIFRMTVMTIIICLAAFFLIRIYYRHVQILELKEKNIYEIVTMNPQNEEKEIQLTSYYMICEPGKTIEEVKEQINTFISDNDVVTTLTKTYVPNERLEDIQFHLVFLQPTKKWPIGKFTNNRENFDLWTGMVVASVSVTEGQYSYTFHKPDGELEFYDVNK